jgi:hypothetical protein
MRRQACTPRVDWQARLQAQGFDFHTIDGEPYWREDICYVFGAREIDEIEAATNELHALCMEAVDRVVRDGRYEELGLDARAAALVERSWWDREPALYGRMDLVYDGSAPPRLLEYNADTPTRRPRCSRLRSPSGTGCRMWPPRPISSTRSMKRWSSGGACCRRPRTCISPRATTVRRMR